MQPVLHHCAQMPLQMLHSRGCDEATVRRVSNIGPRFWQSFNTPPSNSMLRREPTLLETIRGVIRRAAQDLDELKMVNADEKPELLRLKDELRAAAPGESDSDCDES
jgi:hypothetical protein